MEPAAGYPLSSVEFFYFYGCFHFLNRARYEEVHNIVDSFYQMVGIRVLLLEITLWDEEDGFDLTGQNSGEILDNFRKWRKLQSTNIALLPLSRQKWRSQDNSQLIVVSLYGDIFRKYRLYVFVEIFSIFDKLSIFKLR